MRYYYQSYLATTFKREPNILFKFPITFQIKSYYAKMLPEVLISRERLLAAAKAAPPGPVPFLPSLPPKPSSRNNYKPIYVRARQRYFEELAAIWSEVGGEESEDENYPEGPPENTVKKRKTMHPGQVSCFLLI